MPTDAADMPATDQHPPGDGDVRVLRVPMGAQEVVDRLETAARRGKLAGLYANEGRSGADGVLFWLTDFGTPFESVLAVSADGEGSAGTVLRFVRRLKRRMPTVFWVVLVLSMWPGVDVTDSLIRSYWTGYPLTHWQTWMWYMPLTGLSGWWAWHKALRQSQATGRSEAGELVDKVARQLGGEASLP